MSSGMFEDTVPSIAFLSMIHKHCFYKPPAMKTHGQSEGRDRAMTWRFQPTCLPATGVLVADTASTKALWERLPAINKAVRHRDNRTAAQQTTNWGPGKPVPLCIFKHTDAGPEFGPVATVSLVFNFRSTFKSTLCECGTYWFFFTRALSVSPFFCLVYFLCTLIFCADSILLAYLHTFFT